MTLQDSIKKADSLRHLIGELAGTGEQKQTIKAIIPAPTNEEVFHKFVAIYFELGEPLEQIAAKLGAKDFELLAVFDDGQHTRRLSHGWLNRYFPNL